MIKHKSVIKYHVYNIICVRKIISLKHIYIYINNVLHSYKNDVEATEHPLGPLMA